MFWGFIEWVPLENSRPVPRVVVAVCYSSLQSDRQEFTHLAVFQSTTLLPEKIRFRRKPREDLQRESVCLILMRMERQVILLDGKAI